MLWYITFDYQNTDDHVAAKLVLLKCSCCSPVQSWRDWRVSCISTVQAVKSCDVGLDYFSEVGLFAGNGPERHLFVLLENDVISAERPVKDKVNITGNLELRVTTKISKILS